MVKPEEIVWRTCILSRVMFGCIILQDSVVEFQIPIHTLVSLSTHLTARNNNIYRTGNAHVNSPGFGVNYSENFIGRMY